MRKRRGYAILEPEDGYFSDLESVLSEDIGLDLHDTRVTAWDNEKSAGYPNLVISADSSYNNSSKEILEGKIADKLGSDSGSISLHLESYGIDRKFYSVRDLTGGLTLDRV